MMPHLDLRLRPLRDLLPLVGRTLLHRHCPRELNLGLAPFQGQIRRLSRLKSFLSNETEESKVDNLPKGRLSDKIRQYCNLLRWQAPVSLLLKIPKNWLLCLNIKRRPISSRASWSRPFNKRWAKREWRWACLKREEGLSGLLSYLTRIRSMSRVWRDPSMSTGTA